MNRRCDARTRSQRGAPASDLAARRPARRRGVPRSSTGSAAAGQSWWQMLPLGPPDEHGSPYTLRLGVRGLARAARRARTRRSSAAEPDAFAARHAFWVGDWARVRGRRRGRRPGALRARVGRAARVRGGARRAADRRPADLRRARRRRPRAPTRSCSSDGVVAGAPPDALSATASSGATRSTTGTALRSDAATAGGSSASGGRSSSSTWCGSTTSAASSPTGRCRRAPRRRSTAVAARARAASVFDAVAARARRRCP